MSTFFVVFRNGRPSDIDRLEFLGFSEEGFPVIVSKFVVFIVLSSCVRPWAMLVERAHFLKLLRCLLIISDSFQVGSIAFLKKIQVYWIFFKIVLSYNAKTGFPVLLV